MSDAMLLRRIEVALTGYRYRYADEAALHLGMAEALTQADIQFEREVIAGPRDRFDFFLPDGRVVLEAKVKGSLGDALEQCDRYANLETVGAVVLVTTKPWGRTKPLARMRDKPFRLVQVRGAAF